MKKNGSRSRIFLKSFSFKLVHFLMTPLFSKLICDELLKSTGCTFRISILRNKNINVYDFVLLLYINWKGGIRNGYRYVKISLVCIQSVNRL